MPRGALIPDISNKRFPEARAHEDRGLHRILFQFSPDDYTKIGEISNGAHPEDGSTLRVEDSPPEGFTPPDLDEEPQLTAPLGPDIDPEMFGDVATKLFGAEAMKPRSTTKAARSAKRAASRQKEVARRR